MEQYRIITGRRSRFNCVDYDFAPVVPNGERFTVPVAGKGGNCSRGLSRFQTESAIQRGRDVNHVYALEELVPGRGSTKRHSARRVFPDRNHYARNVRGRRATLERLLDASLLPGRSFSERPIHRNDDYVVTIASQMRHLECGHCVISLRSGLRHCYGDFNRRASASMSVFFLELSVFYHPPGMPSFRVLLAALASSK